MPAAGRDAHSTRSRQEGQNTYSNSEPHLWGFFSLYYAVVLQLARDEGLGDDRIADGNPHA